MPKRISVIVAGPQGEHTVKSPSLSDEEATQQFEELGKYVASPNKLKLPWLVVHGKRMVAAFMEEEHQTRPRGGSSGRSLKDEPM